MARPKIKTETATLKMSPEVRELWERCAAQEHRSLTNMFEVMVRDYARRLKLDVAADFSKGVKAEQTTGQVALPDTTSSKSIYKK